jgi:long-subunit acyl-CoA synthetase (AMP-forming)
VRWPPGDPAAAGRIDPSQAVVQVYTSGTSGRPKGVVLSHHCFLDVIREVVRAGDEFIDWKPHDVTLLALPPPYVGGLWFAIHGLVNGATNVAMKAFHGAVALEYRAARDRQGRVRPSSQMSARTASLSIDLPAR